MGRNIEFRLPTEKEIDVRIGSIKENGLTLLLYQDARVGMTILDETVGSKNWQRKHEVINGNLFCSVGINVNYEDETKEPLWVWKQDVGVESYTEKEKGQSSDAFKRAVVNWNICRCLYSAPFIWISSDNCNIKNVNGKYQCYDKFVVQQIIYDEQKNIVALAIRNTTTKKNVFIMDNRKKADDGVPSKA